MKKDNRKNRNYGYKGDKNNLKRCEAVSDMVGAILMVSLVVIGIGAVSVVITSQSTPVDVPSMSIIPDTNANDLFLYHSGGDSLKRGEFIVRVDGEDFNPSELSLIPLGDDDGESDWDSWGVGESLVVPGKSDYSQVQIISTGGGHGSLIAGSGEAVITPTGTATATPTVTPTATATATPTVTPTPEPDVPVADFTGTPTNGSVPLTVQFTDLSTEDPTSWLWDFGDGTTSTEENPEHVYSTFGTFTVTLTATNPSGSGDITKTDYITVIPSQSCEVEGITGSYYENENFAGTPVKRIDQRIRFADQRAIDDERYDYGSDITDWPNPIIGRDERFSVIYEGYLMIDEEDDYTFYLTSDDGSRLWIDDNLVVDNWGDHSPKEESGNVRLTEGFHPVKVEMYEKTGHAVLQLEWESEGFGRGFVEDFCAEDCCKVPTAGFTADKTSGGVPLTVQFSDSSSGSPTSWLWSFGDGTTSTEKNPEHTYAGAGEYDVSLKAANAAGYDYENKSSYITVTGLPSPVGWWKFDEASGSTAVDSSGNGNDGSIKGTYSRVAGACGDGLYFDGTSTYVLVSNDDTLDAPKYIAYAAWLKPEPPVNPNGMASKYLNFTSLICKGSQDEDNYELFIRNLDGTSKFSFETYSGSYKEYSTTGFGYEYGQWQHVAFVADTDSGAATLYINGEYAATVTSSLPDSFATNNNALTIGVQQMYSPYFFRYKGVMDEVMLYTVALTDDQIREIYGICTPSPTPNAPVADFTADTASGDAPLTVSFTDSSTNSPTSWLWDFGDGTTSTEQSPEHTYDESGIYSVALTTTNAGGTDTVTKTDYIDISGVEISDFARFVVDEGVFIYGEKLEFNGDSINGLGSTVIITNDLKADKINGGASLSASNIYVENTIDMDKGGADIGSQRNPGIIYAGNDMKLLQGNRNVYGEVHVGNNLELKDARIHNNVYVSGDLKLEHEPWIADDAYIYYVGKIDFPKNFPQSILDKCIKVDSVPEISIPEYSIPNAKQASWYSSHGYNFDDGDKILSSGIKILSDGNYERKRDNSDDPRNIIIVSKDGDIKLENYNKPVSGILFAPKGKVTFKGDSFEGLVIAKDGFYVEQGGTDITFKNMEQFITNPAYYPF